MDKINFSDLSLNPRLKRAIDEMGFSTATEIQSKAIPLIRDGFDVIGKSQTGTGKTVAFALPAIEKVDTGESKRTVQILILCPTRELAQQACGEIQKLTKFKDGIRVVDIYGGVPMERQIVRLKKANIVIGTPGRVMDHMRRRTLKLDNVKMVVLDEADEMLSMGFKDDIEFILNATPQERQTVLFSATMPPAILALTKEFQKSPKIIEINKKKVTIDNIKQSYVDVPMGRKTDCLNLLLGFYKPKLAIIFCNTKRMVDELTNNLIKNGFNVKGLHGDMKQSQRTEVMDSFKTGKTSVLVATDVAARGIDVNNVDYVINYDIPQNTEYYVHRIGRTGRAGKSGCSITICSGRRQVRDIFEIAAQVKSTISKIAVPTVGEIVVKNGDENYEKIKNLLSGQIKPIYMEMVNNLKEENYTAEQIAASLIKNFIEGKSSLNDISVKHTESDKKVVRINIGRSSHVAPAHIVGAIAERTCLSGKDIGKIEIYDDESTVSLPSATLNEVLNDMKGCKICGKPVTMTFPKAKRHQGSGRRNYRKEY